MKTFLTGFVQVFLVSANIYFISRKNWAGIAVCGFFISYLWTINVRKVAVGSTSERIIYSTGACLGGISGVILANLIRN